jgi:ketosteroid isomerase-like protein
MNKREIIIIHDEWIRLEQQGDIDSLEKFLTNDVICIPEGGVRIEGKADFLNFLKTDEVQIIEIKTENLEIRGNEQIAYKVADFETRFVLDGSESYISGTHLWILKKEDSVWKIDVITWKINQN